ncbi:unnamed protein product [Prunus brigantina]
MPKPGVEANVDEKVETSINPTTCVWNENAIDIQVDVMDARLIKAMPLGDGNEADRMVWPFNRDGRFTVKSGDNLLIYSTFSSQTSRPSGSWVIDKTVRCVVVFEGVQVCSRKTLSAAESMISKFMQVQNECVVNMNDNGDVAGAAEARCFMGHNESLLQNNGCGSVFFFFFGVVKGGSASDHKNLVEMNLVGIVALDLIC